MIRVCEVQKAMKMLENPVEYLSCSAVHKELAKALETSEDKGLYDNTLSSAIKCLILSGYVVEGYEELENYRGVLF